MGFSTSVVSTFFSYFISLSVSAFLMRIHPLGAPCALPGSMLVLAVSTLWPLQPTAAIANMELVFRPPISLLPMFLWQPVWQSCMRWRLAVERERVPRMQLAVDHPGWSKHGWTVPHFLRLLRVLSWYFCSCRPSEPGTEKGSMPWVGGQNGSSQQEPGGFKRMRTVEPGLEFGTRAVSKGQLGTFQCWEHICVVFRAALT